MSIHSLQLIYFNKFLHSFVRSFVHSFRFILLFLLDQSDLIRIAARFDMDTERDAFVSSLAKFTYLTTIKAQVVTADIELSHVEKRCPEPYEALGSRPLCHTPGNETEEH